MATPILDEIINTKDYPINQTNSATYKQLIERLQSELKATGIALLPQFMTEVAINKTLKAIEQSSHLPFRKEVSHNIYLEDNDDEETLDENHPKTFAVRSCKTCFTHDQIDLSTPLNRLFLSSEMTEFIRCVLGKERLYRTADELGALNVHKYFDGDELGWHFDRGEFAVTLLLQEPKIGGEFEYCPSIRNEENPNYSKLTEILTLSKDGHILQERGVKTANFKAGSLSIFCGHHSLHRVKPVQGDLPRYLAVLSYEQNPNVHLNDYTKMKFFGRLK